MYLPISIIIKRAPSQYALAYIYSEQDSYDLTYFYDFHIKKIMLALKDFNDYLGEKILENRGIDEILSKEVILNDRQKYLIHYLISKKNAYATATSHAVLNKISRQTAAKDIKLLENKGFVERNKEGKFVKYRPTLKLLKRAKGK